MGSKEIASTFIEPPASAPAKRVVRRRSFLQGLGMAGAAVPFAALAAKGGSMLAEDKDDHRRLSRGDAAILRFLAAAEIIETDLWEQYEELGGVNGGNPAYTAALQNLDSDMPQYITDNTTDERSHVLFLNAYLKSKGEATVNLDAFRTLPGSRATGSKQIGRLTNLTNLDVDISWYTRYRSEDNLDLGAHFKGPFTISNQPAIPLNDSDTPPNMAQPVPPTTSAARRMQAIANTAGFHFATIEQGGSSLYATMAQKASHREVLRIIVSIGGAEVNHYAIWHDKAGNAVSDPLAGVTDPETGVHFPNLNVPAREITQTNKIMPVPCDFISQNLPPCSVIRPSSVQNSGAVAAVKFLSAEKLFHGQPEEFFEMLLELAVAADAAHREF